MNFDELKELLCGYCVNGIPIKFDTLKRTAEELDLYVDDRHDRSYTFCTTDKRHNDFTGVNIVTIKRKSDVVKKGYTVIYVPLKGSTDTIKILGVSAFSYSFKLDAWSIDYINFTRR